jgi:hypothetical protein
MNIIEIFAEAFQTDCCDTDKQSAYLKEYYEGATQMQQAAINETMICLCGWSFETLLGMEGKEA